MLCPYPCGSRQRCVRADTLPSLQLLPSLRGGREDVRCFLLICKPFFVSPLRPAACSHCTFGQNEGLEGLFSTAGGCKEGNVFLMLLQCSLGHRINMYPRGAALQPSNRPAGLSQAAHLDAHRSALPLILLSTENGYYGCSEQICLCSCHDSSTRRKLSLPNFT